MISNKSVNFSLSPFSIRHSTRSLCNRAALVCLILLLQFVLAAMSPAEAFSRPADRAAATPTPASTGNLNLDLSSTTKSVSAGLLEISDSVNISAGGAARTINPTDLLTAAEFVAASQVISGGIQTLKVAPDGSALRGRFSLNQSMASQLTGLVIPQHVKLFQDFGTLASLSMTGDLVNSGKIFAFSTNPTQSLATFNAQNIVNQSSGLITSVLSSECGASNAISNLSLSLNAAENIINYGTIISAGDLGLHAGGTISNATELSVVHSLGSINLFSSNVTNAGLISSSSGSITFAALNAAEMNIINTNGTLLAPLGAINVRAQNYSGNANSNLLGGNVLSSVLNLNTGNGTTNVIVNQLTGVVNSSGYGAHVQTSTSNLQLGNIDLVDPTFYNDAPDGDITITGNISVQEDLTIVASRNILATSAATSITTQDLDGKGHAINLIAGANIDASGCTGCSSSGQTDTTTPNGTALPSGQYITILGASSTGGTIDLTGASNGLTLDSSSTSSGLDAGPISLIAFANNSGNNGKILLSSNSQLNAKSVSTGKGGAVVILAGGNGASALGGIDNTGGTENGNNILIANSQPDVTGGINIFANGSLSANFSQGILNGSGNISLSDTVIGSANILFDTSNVHMGPTAEITALYTGANILFNSTQAHGIFLEGDTPTTHVTGKIAANNLIDFNGGNETVTIDIFEIAGTAAITANGNYIWLSAEAGGITVGDLRASTHVRIYGREYVKTNGGQIVSPSIAIESQFGSLGQEGSPFSIASGLPNAGSLLLSFYSPVSARFTDNLLGDDIVIKGGVAQQFLSLESKGDITYFYDTIGTGLASENITIRTSSGSIGTKERPLIITSAGNADLRTVKLIAQAPESVWLYDWTTKDTVQLDNLTPSSISSAGASFSLTARGNITSSLPSKTIDSPEIIIDNIVIWGELKLPLIAFSPLGSLDLKNPASVQKIVKQQELNLIGGDLVVVNGVAVGGNMILQPANLPGEINTDTFGHVAGFNIPNGVTVEFTGFSFLSPVKIYMFADSPKQILDGTVSFTNSPNTRLIFETSQNLDKFIPALYIGKTGTIISNDDFTLRSAGNINIAGAVQISTPGKVLSVLSYRDLTFSANIGNSSTDLVIEARNLNQRNCVITANSLSLLIYNNIGTSLSPIKTSTTNLSFYAMKGTTTIVNTGALTLGDSRSFGAVTLTNIGQLIVNDIDSSTSSITVSTSGGALQVADASHLSAKGGSLILQNTSDANASISIGQDSALLVEAKGRASLSIVIGRSRGIAPKGPTPANVQVVGPSVYFGAAGITALPPNNLITSNGQNIVFNTTKAPSSAISLNGSVQFSATRVVSYDQGDNAFLPIIDTGEFASDTEELEEAVAN